MLNIMDVVRREEMQLQRQVGKLQDRLQRVQLAAKSLGAVDRLQVHRHVSADARARMSIAAKKRWSKIRARNSHAGK